MSKTTIQLSEDTKANLDTVKRGSGESYDTTVAWLIRFYNEEGGESESGERLDEILGKLKDMESQLPRKVAEELR